MGISKSFFFYYFFLLLTCSRAVGQEVSFVGKLTDSLNLPIQGANVLLVTIDKPENVKFKISDSEGAFTFSVLPNKTYQIEISYLGYKPIKEEVQTTTQPINKTFQLKDVLIDLEEVIVKSAAAIQRRKDTVIYNPQSFLKGTERNVEDLLKQLPGVQIGEDGKISVDNQEIEKILIDNDDFLGKRYRLISKNLRAETIEAVEIISKYHDNPLLKDIVDSDKKAINLKLKRAYKNVWFGNLDLGHDVAGEKFNKLNFNLMEMGGKVKHYFIGNFNNKGESAGNDAIVIDLSSIGDVSSLAEGRNLNSYYNASPFSLSIKSERYRNTNLKLGNYNNIINLSDRVKWTNNFIGQWTKSRAFDESTATYREGLDFTNTRSKQLLSNRFTGEINSALEATLSASENLKIKASYQHEGIKSTQSNIFNNDPMTELYRDTKDRLDFKGSYVNKLSSKTIWAVNSRFINITNPETYDINDFLYNDLFPELNGDGIHQDLQNKLQVKAINSKLVTKQNEDFSYNLETGLLHSKDYLKTLVYVLQDKDLYLAESFLNDQDFIKRELYLSGSAKYVIQDFSFNLGFNARHLNTTLEEADFVQKQHFSYIEPVLSIGYNLKDKQQWQLNYSKRFSNTPAYLLNRRPILMGLQNMSKGFSAFDHISAEAYSLSYRYGNWMDVFTFNLRTTYNLDKDYFTSKMIIEPNYSYIEQTKGKGQKRWSVSPSINYYIDGISSNLSLGASFSQLDYKTAVNSDDYEAVRSQNWNVKTGLASTFAGLFNFSLSGELNHNSSKRITMRSNTYLKADATTYFSISPEFAISSSIETYQFFDSSIKQTNFLDLTANYKVTLFDKDFDFSLEGKNLLDNNNFYQSSVSETYSSSELYRILPRMVFLSVNWGF